VTEPRPRYRAVLFDMDQTLVDHCTAMRQALADTLAALKARLGTVPEWLTVDAMASIRDEVAEELRGQGVSLELVRRAGFLRTLERLDCGDEKLASELAGYYQKRRFAWTRAYDDVIPTLEELSAQHVLGVVSNGNTYPERCGLGHLFHACVFSHDVGVDKPDPRPFRVALSRAGCEPREALHVGDSLTEDVLGAQRAGITAVWLNREGIPNDTSIRPDAEIRSLLELPSLCAATPA